MADFTLIMLLTMKVGCKRANKARKLIKESIEKGGDSNNKVDKSQIEPKQQTIDQVVSIRRLCKICLQLGHCERTRKL